MTTQTITISNTTDLEAMTDKIGAIDLRNELAVGQTVEVIRTTGGRSLIETVIYDNDRVGIFAGGDSAWGDLLEDRTVRLDDDGQIVDLQGQLISE